MLSCSIGDGIGDRGGGRPLPSLASAQEWQARAIDDVDLSGTPWKRRIGYVAQSTEVMRVWSKVTLS